MEDRKRQARTHSLIEETVARRQQPAMWDAALTLNQMSAFTGSEHHHPLGRNREPQRVTSGHFEGNEILDRREDQNISVPYCGNTREYSLHAGSRPQHRHDDDEDDDEDDDGDIDRLRIPGGSVEFSHMLTFPQQLMEILSNDELFDIISWLPHGKSFFVKNRDRLSNEVLPKYFDNGAEYRSFTRRLLRWGFKRVPRGDEVGAFFHKFFVRGKPELCFKIRTCSRKPGSIAKPPTKKKTIQDSHEEIERKEKELHQQELKLQHLKERRRLMAEHEKRRREVASQANYNFMYPNTFEIPYPVGMNEPAGLHPSLEQASHYAGTAGGLWPQADMSFRTDLPVINATQAEMLNANLFFDDASLPMVDPMHDMHFARRRASLLALEQQGSMIGQVFAPHSAFNRNMSNAFRQNQMGYEGGGPGQFVVVGALQEEPFPTHISHHDMMYEASTLPNFFDKTDTEQVDANAVVAAARQALHDSEALQNMGILDMSECNNMMAADFNRQDVITATQNYQHLKSRFTMPSNSGAA